MKSLEIIFICIAAIFTVIVTYNWKKITSLAKVALIVSIIAAVLVAINSFRQKSKDELIERVNAKFGDIEDLHGATIPLMKIGNSDSGATFDLGKSGVFDFNPYGPLIKLYIKEGNLYVNTIIRNLDGKVIAVIEDNTWTLFENDYEYNDDNKTALELVTKGSRVVFFQVELKNGIAYISGHLLNDKGEGFIFFNPQGQSGSLMFLMDNETKKSIPKDIFIPRIFKYPRDKYYGKRM